jgi:hypothetical protein
MNAKLWITTDDQMDMVWHHFYLYKLLLPFLNTFLDECFQSGIDWRKQDLSSVLRAEHDMVVTIIGDIFVASSYCSHAYIIAENNSLVKWKLANGEKYPSAQAPKKEAASIPMPEGLGFYAALDKLFFCTNE